MERLFQQHVNELKSVGWIGSKHVEIAERMDRAVEEMYIDEVEHYLQREPNPEGHREILGKRGLLGICVPEEYGGLEGDSLALALAFERLGQLGMGPVTFLDVQCCLGESILLEWSTDEQKRRYLAPAAKGEKVLAFCLTETESGSDPTSLATEYQEVDDGFELYGEKYLISNGSIADSYIVFAYPKGKREGMSAFLVDKDEDHVKINMELKEKIGLFTSDTALVEFEKAFVPRDNLLGERGMGLPIAYTGLLSGRIGVAAGCVGTIEDCLNEATERAKSRVQYGKPIGKHQLIQRHISRIVEELEAARWPVYAAAYWKREYDRQTRDSGLRRVVDHKASLAKKIASDSACQAADHALQIFGGYGYSILCAPARHYTDVRVSRIYEGTDEIMELKIASHILGKEFAAYE